MPRRRAALLGAGALLLLAATAAALALSRGSNPGVAGIARAAPNTVVALDAASGRLVAQTPVGAGPEMIAYGAGRVWVANVDDRSVSSIDPRTHRATGTRVSLGVRPAGIAFGEGALWG